MHLCINKYSIMNHIYGFNNFVRYLVILYSHFLPVPDCACAIISSPLIIGTMTRC